MLLSSGGDEGQVSVERAAPGMCEVQLDLRAGEKFARRRGEGTHSCSGRAADSHSSSSSIRGRTAGSESAFSACRLAASCGHAAVRAC